MNNRITEGNNGDQDVVILVEGDEREKSAGDKELVRDEGVVTDTMSGVRRRMPRWALVVALSLGIHEPIFHNQVKAAADDYIVQPYNEWVAARAKIETEQEMSSEFKDALKGDREKISERNMDRMARVAERAEAAKGFKAKLFEDYATTSFSDVFFDIEYYDQGVSDEEMSVAKPYFNIVADKVSVADNNSPTHDELKSLVKAFMPDGSFDRIKTSAVHSLVQKLGPKSQNCVARNRLMIMGIATKYPGLQQNLYVQKFGDHERAVFEIDGKKYILEGDVPTFPDAETAEKKNELMPFEVWLALYSGHKRKEFENRIEKFGPQSEDREKPKDFARATDNMVQDNFWDNDLDNVGTAESWFGGGTGTAANGANSSDAGVDVNVGGEGNDNGNEDLVGSRSVADGAQVSSLLDKEVDPNSLESPNLPMMHSIYYLDFPKITKADVEAILSMPNAQQIRTIKIRLATTIDKETAQALVDLQSKTAILGFRNLEFERLNKMDEETSRILGGFSGSIIFEGFSAVPVEVMRGLSETKASIIIKAPIVSEEAISAFIGELPGSKMTDFFDINDLLPEDADSNYDVSKNNAGAGAPQRYRNMLTLIGLTGLSNDAALALSRYEGALTLAEMPLTAENVNMLAQTKNLLILRDISAQNFQGFEKGCMSGVTIEYPNGEFPVEAAKSLYNLNGMLNINAEFLSMESARYLAQRDNKVFEMTLRMGKLGKNELIEIFKSKANLRVILNLFIVDEEIAEAISKHQGRVNLSGRIRILPEAAVYFGKMKGERLSVNSLYGHNVEVIRGLSSFDGELEVRLVDEEKISLQDARALSSHKGDLTVNVEDLTPAILRELMKVEGTVYTNGVKLLTYEMALIIQERFRNPALAKYNVYFHSADVTDKRAAVIFHNLNNHLQGRYKVVIEEIAMMKVNAPYREEIKWGE